MAFLNPREEIVSLLRGYFTCPLISFLGKKGVLDKMVVREFSENTFTEVVNKEIFRAILVYFEAIGLVVKHSSEGKYKATEIGEKIFKRYGSFCLLHSYGNFLDKLEYILFDKNYKGKVGVERLENIVGSGQTNSRKYFPSAIDMLGGGVKPAKLIDVGCGNGKFLNLVSGSFPECKLVGVDLSEEALKETSKNIKDKRKEADIKTVQSDGRNVSLWLPSSIDDSDLANGNLVISLWYLLHEISQNNPNEIIRFLNEVYRVAPYASIIIGEITNVPIEVLIENKNESIMPEYLFFHKISGQGVLGWQEYKSILKEVPYTIKQERLFDVLEHRGENMPSGFVWHLIPKGKKNEK